MAISDSELWEQVLQHDGQAFAQIFDRHSHKVYNHCFRRTADWSLAEDLTSIVFLEAWRRRKSVRLHDDSILPWLLAVANNSLCNALRSRRRYRRLLAKLPSIQDLPAEDAETIARIEEERLMSCVLEDLRALRPDEQDVLALCDWSGLTLAEAAVTLDIPLGTVKSRLSRARAELRARQKSSGKAEGTGEVTPG